MYMRILHVSADVCGGPEAPESIGSAVTGSCERSTVGAGNQLKCSARLACASLD